MTPRIRGFWRNFWRRLATLRFSAGLTQEDLSRRMRLTRCSITNIEAGRQAVMLHDLGRLSVALGCDVSDLVPPEWR